MELKTIEQRQHYIDHLRAFMFILMAIDHSLHAYADKFGRFWFFQDIDRTSIFDMFYVFDQSIIMPMIFFTIGMFVLPSLKRRGLVSFTKERLIRIGIPFAIGVPFIVPILSYPKYEWNVEPNISYWDFWSNHYFSESLQGGPFWVMYAILLYTFALVLAYYIAPALYRLLVKVFKALCSKPVIGYMIFATVSAVVLGVSDWLWGAPWWTGFWKIFNLQTSRIGLVVMYFLSGSLAVSAGIIQDNKFMNKLASNWLLFGALTVIFGGAYMYYCSEYYHIAYIFPAISNELPFILIRTTLHAFLCLSQVLFLLAIFRKFFDKPTKAWTSLASNAWGIFIIHESIVVWMQYWLINSTLSIPAKFLLTATVGITGAWILTDFLRKLPGFKRVLGTQVYKK